MHHRRVLIRLQSLREHIRWTGYPEVREQPVKQLDEGTLLVPGLNLQAADRQEPQRMRSRWCGLWDSEFIKVDVDILQMQLLEARTVLCEMDEGRARWRRSFLVVGVRVGILTRVIGCVWGIVEEPEESEVRERATEPRDFFVCRFGHDVVHLPRILE